LTDTPQIQKAKFPTNIYFPQLLSYAQECQQIINLDGALDLIVK